MEQPSGNTRKAALFVALTYAVSWAYIGLYMALGGPWAVPWIALVGVIYMFIPLTIALIVQGLVYKQPIVGPLGISFRVNRWWLVAWLTMPVLALATLGVSLLFPSVHYDPQMSAILGRLRGIMPPDQYQEAVRQIRDLPIFWISLFGGMIAGATVNAVAGFGEELGWRGLLQRELGHLGFWKSSALIGLIWGVWHFPLILKGWNYPQHPVIGVGMMIVWTVLLAPIFSLVRLKARSVIAAAILHGTLNGTAGVAILLIRGGNDLTVGMTGLAGFIVLALVNLAIYFYTRAHPVSALD